ERALVERIPVLGICLGAQLLTKGSEEGREQGLGWVDAYCRRFDVARMPSPLPVPNMGWADVRRIKPSILTEALPEPARFYFAHSYEIVCNTEEDRLLTARYGYEYTAAFERGNIAGTQFHPEKSHKFGMRLLGNFAGTR